MRASGRTSDRRDRADDRDRARDETRFSVPRERLLEVLDRSNDGGLVLLVAPAGSGKSVLLSQCTQKTARPTIWLELTEAHNDAVVLTRDLCAAVNTTHPGFDASISESVEVGGARLGDGFLDAFEAGLAQLEEPVELVLDDLHSLTNGDIGADLGTAIRSMGPEARVLLAGRWDPPFRMGRMRLDAETFELRAGELAFDAVEARELLTGLVGRSLDQIDLSTLLERTEGWAAALKLAGLSMRQADDIDLFVKRFDGDDRMVAEYLTEEVLDSLDPPTRQFLFDTAVAPWLDPDLCERLTGRTDALATLEQLNDRGLFVVPVRGHRHRFRYHHLFADLLRYQLRLRDPGRERDRRAETAQWLLEHGHIAEATVQLTDGGEHRGAYEILAAHGHELFELGESATLLELTKRVHSGLPSGSSDIAVALMGTQVAADRFSDAIATHRQLGDLTPPGHQVVADALYTCAVNGDLPLEETRDRARSVEAALERIEPSEVFNTLGIGGAHSVHTIAVFNSGLASLFAGEIPRAAEEFGRVLALPGSRYPVFRVHSLGGLALCHAILGHPSDALSCAETAAEIAREVGAERHVASVLAHTAGAISHTDRAEEGPATACFDAAMEILRRCDRPGQRELVELQRVNALALFSGPDSALESLRSTRTAVFPRPVNTTLRTALEARIRLQLGLSTNRLLFAEPANRGDVRDPTAAAHFDVLSAEGSLSEARAVLERWRFADSDDRSRVERELRRAVLLDAEGRTANARRVLSDALAAASGAGLHATVATTPGVRSLVAQVPPRPDEAELRAFLSTAVDRGSRLEVNRHLLEPLTERELAVLDYLPSRLGNSELSAALFVSVNTVKTHLRNIYRKLDAPDRDAAVARARERGLL